MGVHRAPRLLRQLQAAVSVLGRWQRRHALLLFLAFGALLFTVDGLRHEAPVLDPPAEAGDAAQWLEDEVLYREALQRGLAEGDVIVRRRLVQKMRQLLETGVDVAEPDEAMLRDWVNSHPGRYGRLARLSLDHVFLSRGHRGARLAEDAALTAAALEYGKANAAALSDPHPAGVRAEALDARASERLFGSALSAQFGELPEGRWQGPLASALGLHFIRVDRRELLPPDFLALRERARRDYLLQQRRVLTQQALEQLKSRHGVLPAPVNS